MMQIQRQQQQLLPHTDKINDLLARYGVKFGIYKNNTFKEQLFPFDSIPRIIEHVVGKRSVPISRPYSTIDFLIASKLTSLKACSN